MQVVLRLERSLTVLEIQVSGTSESSTNSPEHHAIVLPPSTGGGKRVHPIPYIEGGIPGMPSSYMLKLCNELIFLVPLMPMLLLFVWT